MSEIDRLRDRLAKLAATGISATRDVVATDSRARLRVVLEAIDETVLPRRIDFASGSDALLRLDVSGRRLLRLVGPPPEGVEGVDASLFDTPLDPADEARIASLGSVVDAVLAPSEHFRITATGLASDDNAPTGIAAEVLARGWSVELPASRIPEPAARIAGILAALGPAVRALVCRDGPVESGRLGTAEKVERIEAIVGERMSTEGGSGPRFVALDWAALGGTVIFARAGEVKLVALVDTAALGRAFRAWRGETA